VKRIPRPIRPAPEEGAFHKPEDEMPKFVITGLKEQLDPDYHEYVNCLKVFGLRPGADLAAIKNAYRNAVKEYHPDRNRNAQEMAAEVFIEMTRTYERLIELHTKQGKRPTT
jgi:preprotein translocase subunit Sec63